MCGATATRAETVPHRRPATSRPPFSSRSIAATAPRVWPTALISASSRLRSKALRTSVAPRPTVPSTSPSPPSIRNIARYVFCTRIKPSRTSPVARTSTPSSPRFLRSASATACSWPEGTSTRKKLGDVIPGKSSRELSSDTSNSRAKILPGRSPTNRSSPAGWGYIFPSPEWRLHFTLEASPKAGIEPSSASPQSRPQGLVTLTASCMTEKPPRSRISSGTPNTRGTEGRARFRQLMSSPRLARNEMTSRPSKSFSSSGANPRLARPSGVPRSYGNGTEETACSAKPPVPDWRSVTFRWEKSRALVAVATTMNVAPANRPAVSRLLPLAAAALRRDRRAIERVAPRLRRSRRSTSAAADSPATSSAQPMPKKAPAAGTDSEKIARTPSKQATARDRTSATGASHGRFTWGRKAIACQPRRSASTR